MIDSPTRRGARPRQSRLARFVPQLLVCRLLRPGAHGLRSAARDQRGPRAAGHGLRHPRPPRHGDHLATCSKGQLAHKDNMGNGSIIAPGRRAAHERGPRRAAQRIQPVERRTACISCRSGSSRTSARRCAVLRADAMSRRTRSAGGCALIAGPEAFGRGGDDPPGRARLRGAARWRRDAVDARARAGAARVRARGARQRVASTARR